MLARPGAEARLHPPATTLVRKTTETILHDDPLLYHLHINTDLLGCEKAARLICDAVVMRP